LTKKKKTMHDIELKSLARSYTTASIAALGGWATSEATNEDIRLRAIGMLLDRGWGRPESITKHAGVDSEDIKVTIRTIIENKGGK
jgi:hypothetical protein